MTPDLNRAGVKNQEPQPTLAPELIIAMTGSFLYVVSDCTEL